MSRGWANAAPSSWFHVRRSMLPLCALSSTSSGWDLEGLDLLVLPAFDAWGLTLAEQKEST